MPIMWPDDEELERMFANMTEEKNAKSLIGVDFAKQSFLTHQKVADRNPQAKYLAALSATAIGAVAYATAIKLLFDLDVDFPELVNKYPTYKSFVSEYLLPRHIISLGSGLVTGLASYPFMKKIIKKIEII